MSGFFFRLWKSNGFGRVDEYGRVDLDDDLKRGVELVVPATEEKPLVYLRGRYQERPQADRDAERARQRGWNQDQAITVGTERDEILLAPTEGNAWIPLLSYKHDRQGGGAVVPGPHSQTQWRGQTFSEWDFRSQMPMQSGELAQAYIERVDEVFANHVRQLLTETVQLLS